METINKQTANYKAKISKADEIDEFVNKRGYYFHSDEDFREDWNWGKKEPANGIRPGLSTAKAGSL